MRKIKKNIALLLIMAVFVSANSSIAFAAETNSPEFISEEEVQPRIGYAAHHTYSLDGNTPYMHIKFTTSLILFPYQQWSIKTSNVNDDIVVTCSIVDINYNAITNSTSVRGNQEVKNMPLITDFQADKVYILIVNTTNRYTGQPTACTGTFEFWLF